MINTLNGQDRDKKTKSTRNKVLLIALAISLALLVIMILLFIFVLLPFAMQSPVKIGPGEVGVVLDQGEVQDKLLYEGLHFVVPMKKEVVKVDVRVQRLKEKITAQSSDNEYIEYELLLNYHIYPDKAHLAYKEQRLSNSAVASLVEDAIKNITVRQKADELLANKTKLEVLFKKEIKPVLEEYHASLDKFSIVNIVPQSN